MCILQPLQQHCFQHLGVNELERLQTQLLLSLLVPVCASMSHQVIYSIRGEARRGQQQEAAEHYTALQTSFKVRVLIAASSSTRPAAAAAAAALLRRCCARIHQPAQQIPEPRCLLIRVAADVAKAVERDGHLDVRGGAGGRGE